MDEQGKRKKIEFAFKNIYKFYTTVKVQEAPWS